MYGPSTAAALVYGAVKVVGYTFAAHGLNRILGASVRPVVFGFTKTAIGFLGGWLFLFAFDDALEESGSDFLLYAGATLFRLIAWAIVLRLFFKLKPQRLTLLATAGTVWSYALDVLMWGIYKILPGTVVPWC